MQTSIVKVGVFDSGIGGLTTLNACVQYARKWASKEKEIIFYYYGDNFRAPYGNLPNEKITEYAEETFERFSSLNVDAAVIACNTVTAVCVDGLRNKYSFPILGIEPALFLAAKELKNGEKEVLTLSTKATFLSKRFNCLCARARGKYPDLIFKNYFCEGLAGEIENRLEINDFDYSHFLPKTSASAVVLGCTHYVYIQPFVERFYGCRTVDGNDGVARRLFSVLASEGKLAENKTVDFVDNGKLPLKGKVLHLAVDNSCWGTKVDIFFQKNGDCEKFEGYKGLKVENLPLLENCESVSIVFIGEGKMVNKTKYEQMFASK